jgi:tetratricopeptide (TPR) repeat protein
MKWIAIASLACLLGLGGTAYALLSQGEGNLTVPTGTAGADAATANQPHAELMVARRTGRMEDLDALVDRRRAGVRAQSDDPAAQIQFADALLERVLQRNQLRGMTIGQPIHTKLPAAISADLEEGLAAVAAARKAGLDTADSYRIEAGLLSNKITGLGSAMQFNSQVHAALTAAYRKEPNSPQLHMALGLRKLLAPKLLGHDAEKALEHLEFAANAMSDDERPSVFAAMAAFLTRRKQKAIEWLEKAVASNPNNAFARVVLSRLRRDEADPFGRDVSAAEAAPK